MTFSSIGQSVTIRTICLFRALSERIAIFSLLNFDKHLSKTAIELNISENLRQYAVQNFKPFASLLRNEIYVR